MSSDKKAEDEEFLAAVRKARAESVRFFSSSNRAERELWVAGEFLTNLGLEHSRTELEHVTDDPPDVRFRDAAFEIKEIVEAGRQRHAEYKASLRKAIEATKPSDVFEPVMPRDITYQEVYGLVEENVTQLQIKYAPGVRAQLDLLFYVSFEDVFGYVETPLPDGERLREAGFRSVCVVIGRLAGVLLATSSAPIFLRDGAPRLVARSRGDT